MMVALPQNIIIPLNSLLASKLYFHNCKFIWKLVYIIRYSKDISAFCSFVFCFVFVFSVMQNK